MIDHITIEIRKDKWEQLRKLLEIEHEHTNGMNECAICDEPLIDVAIAEIKKLRTKGDNLAFWHGRVDFSAREIKKIIEGCFREARQLLIDEDL